MRIHKYIPFTISASLKCCHLFAGDMELLWKHLPCHKYHYTPAPPPAAAQTAPGGTSSTPAQLAPPPPPAAGISTQEEPQETAWLHETAAEDLFDAAEPQLDSPMPAEAPMSEAGAAPLRDKIAEAEAAVSVSG
jgi:hypothetical protein